MNTDIAAGVLKSCLKLFKIKQAKSICFSQLGLETIQGPELLPDFCVANPGVLSCQAACI